MICDRNLNGMMIMTIRLATVFSGIGSVEHALDRMGVDYEIVFACDNGNIDIGCVDGLTEDEVNALYKDAHKTNFVRKSYMANYECEEENYHLGVRVLDGKPYRDGVDILVGGSPCQSFSFVGGQEGFCDTRGLLFFEFIRLVDEVRPKAFIFENVVDVLKDDTWNVMEEAFRGLDYHFVWRVLNAKDYGVPQNRRRLFVVGFRNDLINDDFVFDFPAEKILDVTLQDLLEEDVNEKYFLSSKMIDYVMSEGTKNFKSKPKVDLEIARPLLSTMHKMHRAGVDNYVTDDEKLRKLTPRECLRLMGFRDDWKIVCSDTQMYKQIGNSIVVDVLIALLEEVLKNV